MRLDKLHFLLALAPLGVALPLRCGPASAPRLTESLNKVSDVATASAANEGYCQAGTSSRYSPRATPAVSSRRWLARLPPLAGPPDGGHVRRRLQLALHARSPNCGIVPVRPGQGGSRRSGHGAPGKNLSRPAGRVLLLVVSRASPRLGEHKRDLSRHRADAAGAHQGVNSTNPPPRLSKGGSPVAWAKIRAAGPGVLSVEALARRGCMHNCRSQPIGLHRVDRLQT